jgi:hypothetical protein
VSTGTPFHYVTVGWDRDLIERLWSGVTVDREARVSHILHPRRMRGDFPDLATEAACHFFHRDVRDPMPAPDREMLASLEHDGVPTLHNMILGDRIVSRLPYGEALSYATFLARRLTELFAELRPSVVIGGFDSIHAALSLAVAQRMRIPWYALHFCVIPPGLACFCDRLTPAARVRLPSSAGEGELRLLAETSLRKFEDKTVRAHAYVAPPPPTLAGRFARLPARVAALGRTLQNARRRHLLRFTDGPAAYDVIAAMRRLRGLAAARRSLAAAPAHATPPPGTFVLFALHTQPESSIDVWAPFFSNQMWVIELLARSIPPSCRLLVKVHKSDVSGYSQEQLTRMRSIPGVELVQPFADSRSFIEQAALVVAIQGTIGLEAALLGKPVIMLGESPVNVFPSASAVGPITELPALIRRKLAEPAPRREEIVESYASYLGPFMHASHNDWTAGGNAGEAERFASLFGALKRHLEPVCA